jgi:hypothetical protein
MPLKTSDEKQDLILKVFDYFKAESKLSLGEGDQGAKPPGRPALLAIREGNSCC